jgi:hypothetical protein
VPNQWAELGCASFSNLTPCAEDWANPYGASHGANTAHTTKTAVSSTPMTSIQRASPVVWVKGLARAEKTRRISTSLAGR